MRQAADRWDSGPDARSSGRSCRRVHRPLRGLAAHPPDPLLPRAGFRAGGSPVLHQPRRGDRGHRRHRGDPDHPAREALERRLVRLTRSTGGSPPILGQGDSAFVTSPAGWVISWLLILFGVAIARDHHRCARRARHRLPAQGGPGHGRIGLPGPHRHLRLERDRPRPHRRAPGRRLSRSRSSLVHRGRPQPRRRRRLLRQGRPDRARRPRAGRHRGRRRGPRLPVRPDRTMPTCARSSRSWRSSRSRPTCGPSPRSTTRATSSTSGGPGSTSSSSRRQLASRLLARSALYPGLDRARHRHRVGRRRLRALPRSSCPRTTSATLDRRGQRPAARRAPGDAALDRSGREDLRQPAGRLPHRGGRRRRGRRRVARARSRRSVRPTTASRWPRALAGL